jgi:protein-S-isoprenylcysteine O-methyltransferase Ste14
MSMIALIAGTASFPLFLLSDWADWRGLRALRVGSITASAGLLLAALAALLLNGDRFAPSLHLRVVGGVFSAVFLFLLASSLFLEIAFFPPRAKGRAERRVITTGTYALCRHPGVLWLPLFLLSIAALSGSRLLLLAVPLWTVADILLVAVEDAVFFPRIFGKAYDEYRRTVPFLVPTPASIARCTQTYRFPLKS